MVTSDRGRVLNFDSVTAAGGITVPKQVQVGNWAHVTHTTGGARWAAWAGFGLPEEVMNANASRAHNSHRSSPSNVVLQERGAESRRLPVL